MNIIVKTFGKDMFYCRPDTTWERENKDIYAPEFTDGYRYTPVLFARICKAGKCIGEKFAGRYYDGAGFGMLLYVDNLLEIAPEGFACASCCDHTSLLPFPLYGIPVVSNPQNRFVLMKNGAEIFSSFGGQAAADAICKAIAGASASVSLRIGDMVAVELSQMLAAASRDEKTARFSAEFCGNELFDFDIKF